MENKQSNQSNQNKQNKQNNQNKQMIELEVNIDFDDASAAWRSNKISKGNGMYKYICQGFFKNGKKCLREPIAMCDFCKIHNK